MTGETITLYEAIGGDETIRRLCHRFYELMDTLPEAARCRAIHPESLAGSEAKLYDYLTGYLGGPPVYVENTAIRACARAISAPRSVRKSAMNGCSASAAPWTRRSIIRNSATSSAAGRTAGLSHAEQGIGSWKDSML